MMLDLASWSGERWFVEIVGWTGAALILGAYALLSAGRLTGRSVTYQLMNVVGAAASSSTASGIMPCPRPCSTSCGS